jgi:hypothetical protein
MSRAQSVSEYSICVVIIILAVVVMQVYVKRGLQGRYAEVVDFTTDRAQAFKQFEPKEETQDIGVVQNLNEKNNAYEKGQVNRVITGDSLTRKGTVIDLKLPSQ